MGRDGLEAGAVGVDVLEAGKGVSAAGGTDVALADTTRCISMPASP